MNLIRRIEEDKASPYRKAKPYDFEERNRSRTKVLNYILWVGG